MSKIRILTHAILLLLTVALATAVQDKTYTVAWHPKTGDKHDYAFKLFIKQMESPEGPVDFTMTADLSRTVAEIQKDGKVICKSVMSAPKIKIGDDDTQDLDDSDPGRFTSTFAADGTLLNEEEEGVTKDESDDSGDIDIPDMIYPAAPVKLLQIWQASPSPTMKKAPKEQITKFRMVSEEDLKGIHCFKIELVRKADATAKVTTRGTLWISQSDGSVVRSVFNVKDFQLDKDMPKSDAELTLDLVTK